MSESCVCVCVHHRRARGAPPPPPTLTAGATTHTPPSKYASTIKCDVRAGVCVCTRGARVFRAAAARAVQVSACVSGGVPSSAGGTGGRGPSAAPLKSRDLATVACVCRRRRIVARPPPTPSTRPTTPTTPDGQELPAYTYGNLLRRVDNNYYYYRNGRSESRVLQIRRHAKSAKYRDAVSFLFFFLFVTKLAGVFFVAIFPKQFFFSLTLP